MEHRRLRNWQALRQRQVRPRLPRKRKEVEVPCRVEDSLQEVVDQIKRADAIEEGDRDSKSYETP